MNWLFTLFYVRKHKGVVLTRSTPTGTQGMEELQTHQLAGAGAPAESNACAGEVCGLPETEAAGLPMLC